MNASALPTRCSSGLQTSAGIVFSPMGRVGRPEDYVGSAVVLASELSAFMTGEILHVDGGWTLKGDAPVLVDDYSRERERG